MSRPLVVATFLAVVAFPAAAAAQKPTPPPAIAAPEPEEGVENSHLRFDPRLVDRTTSPCADFYQFACGGWLKANPIPPEEAAWGRFTQLAQKNREDLAEAIEEAAGKKEGLDENARKVVDYYETCMDEAGAERLGLTPVEPALRRIASLASFRDVVLEAGRLRRTGVPALFVLSSTPDARNAKEMIAEADQGGLGLPDRDDYMDRDENAKRLLEKYREHVARTFVLSGDTEELAAKEARAAVSIETALAAGSQTRMERRDPEKLYNRTSLSELRKLAPAVPWTEYFEAVGLGPVSSVNVASPGYFKALDAQLRTVSLDGWKSYLRWVVLRENSPRLNAALVNESFRFFGGTLQGAEKVKPRARRCVLAVDQDLRDLAGQIYVNARFPPAVRGRVEITAALLARAMQADLAKVSWMDEATRARAQDKLKALVIHVAYPDHWVDMSKVRIGRESWPANAEQAARFRFDRELEKVGKPTDRTEWQSTIPSVDASYDPERNAVTLPAGILQPPFYDLWMDDAPTFGALGSLAGHEIIHVFDDEGRHFGADGSLSEWWSARAAVEFARRATCVEKQFSEYLAVDDVHVDGKRTLEENIADLGGLKIAYAAFQDAVKNVRSRLPAKVQGFTAEQRFFLGFAQSRCRALKPEEQRLRADTDPRAPSKFRVNGPVSNMKEFQEAFECPIEAAMVRKAAEVCEMW